VLLPQALRGTKKFFQIRLASIGNVDLLFVSADFPQGFDRSFQPCVESAY
jgi:hypothetical protein